MMHGSVLHSTGNNASSAGNADNADSAGTAITRFGELLKRLIADLSQHRATLAEILRDAVDGGASVSLSRHWLKTR